MRDVVDTCIRVLWNGLKYKAKVKRDYQTVPNVLGSYGALQQVIGNLLQNAVHQSTSRGYQTYN